MALRDRFARFTAITNPCRERLAAEIVAPTGADIATLRAAALAEEAADSGDEASVTSVVSSAVLAELVSLYQPVGQRNYKTIADRFDQAARSFTAAVSIYDPAVDSSAVIRLSERERSAWLGAEVCANELDELLQPLAAAAFLAGAPGAICVLNEDAAALQLPLTVDVDKLHVRKAWAAWADTTTRCGRWAAIHPLGAKIRANGSPDRLQPYAQPQPLTVNWEISPRGNYEKKTTDPHDSPGGIITKIGAAIWSVD